MKSSLRMPKIPQVLEEEESGEQDIFTQTRGSVNHKVLKDMQHMEMIVKAALHTPISTEHI